MRHSWKFHWPPPATSVLFTLACLHFCDCRWRDTEHFIMSFKNITTDLSLPGKSPPQKNIVRSLLCKQSLKKWLDYQGRLPWLNMGFTIVLLPSILHIRGSSALTCLRITFRTYSNSSWPIFRGWISQSRTLVSACHRSSQDAKATSPKTILESRMTWWCGKHFRESTCDYTTFQRARLLKHNRRSQVFNVHSTWASRTLTR